MCVCVYVCDLVKTPDGTDILTPLLNFSEVRRAQLAKSTLLASTLEPLGLSQNFPYIRGACVGSRAYSVNIILKYQTLFLLSY